MTQLLTIELFGQPYTFKTEEHTNKAKEIAEFLVKEVERVEKQQRLESTITSRMATVILTALNIAYENHELKRKLETSYQSFNCKIENLLDLLDIHLPVVDG